MSLRCVYITQLHCCTAADAIASCQPRGLQQLVRQHDKYCWRNLSVGTRLAHKGSYESAGTCACKGLVYAALLLQSLPGQGLLSRP